MKFTTYVPTTDNDDRPFSSAFLERVIDQLWKPFKAMTDEGEVRGHWTNDLGLLHKDKSRKISIDCSRDRLQEAIRAVKKAGRKLRQEAMYFEVAGNDGVQILKLEQGSRE